MSTSTKTKDTAPIVTAVICTFNRAPYLRKAIQSLCTQTMPLEQYEIIVVDNNSTDDTRRVVEEFTHVPNLRYVFEPIQGLCQARNTGCSEALGTYVAYLDDDGVAVPGWTQAVAESFAMADRPVGCVGGAITVLWESPRPAWMPDRLLGYYGDLAYDQEIKYLNGTTEYVGGGNSAYPVDLLLSRGGFDTRMGHKGKKIRFSEEGILHLLMIRDGYALMYNANMLMHHHAGAEKVNYNWIKRRMFWQGFSSVQIERRMGQRSRWPAPIEAFRLSRSWLRRPLDCLAMFNDNSVLSRELLEQRQVALWELGRAYGLLTLE